MAYTVFPSNLAQSANMSGGQAVAALITATGSTDGITEVYSQVFDAAFKKLKAVYDGDDAAKTAATEQKASGERKQQASQNPGDVIFNFGACKGLTVAQVAEMDQAALKAHGEKLVADGWNGTPYDKGGQAYLEYVKDSNNKRLGFMTKVVTNFFDSKRA